MDSDSEKIDSHQIEDLLRHSGLTPDQQLLWARGFLFSAEIASEQARIIAFAAIRRAAAVARSYDEAARMGRVFAAVNISCEIRTYSEAEGDSSRAIEWSRVMRERAQAVRIAIREAIGSEKA